MNENQILMYHKTISKEIEAKEGLLNTLINHNVSIGTYRENVLRNALKSRLPEKYIVGKGFVVNDEDSSTEIDILIYDSSYPVLFKEDDFVVVTPDAVKCIIEVKSTANSKDVQESIRKLSKNSKFIKESLQNKEIFTGLFAFSKNITLGALKQKVILGLLGFPYVSSKNLTEGEFKNVFESLRSIDVNEYMKNRDIDAICICGKDSDIYKEADEESNKDKRFNEIIIKKEKNLNSWIMADLQEKYEEAIFINEVIAFLAPETYINNNKIWSILENDKVVNNNGLFRFKYLDEIQKFIKLYMKNDIKIESFLKWVEKYVKENLESSVEEVKFK